MSKKKTRWNTRLMHKRLDAFVTKNHRIPTRRELKAHNGLPAPYIIEKFGKKNYRLWLQARYPEYVCENWQLDLLAKRQVSRRRWIALFQKEYMRIKPTSGRQYNENRTQGTPTWGTIAKYIGEDHNKWNNFKTVAGVEGISIPPKEKPKTEFKVSVFVEFIQ